MTGAVLTAETCRCGCGRPVYGQVLARSCYEWWRRHGRPDAVPPLGARSGRPRRPRSKDPVRSHAGRATAVQLRDALKVYIWQHLRSINPETWVTSYELCRLIAQRYTCDAPNGHWQGRQVTLESCLAELEAAGEVEVRDRPREAAQGPSRVARQYRWKR